MIQFFRRIRQKLLKENRFSKYLLYAIGEIVLVVIGILIALQINNWNEWRKDRQKEKEILVDLKLNLETNITILESRVEYFNSGQRSGRIILDVIDKRLSNHDSLGYHFDKATRGFGGADIISYVGYEELRNNGFGLITNKSLKNEILHIFEETYRDLISIDGTFVQHNSYLRELISSIFYKNKAESLSPYDFDLIFTTPSYYSSVTFVYYNYKWMQEETEIGLTETRRILLLVEDELNKP